MGDLCHLVFVYGTLKRGQPNHAVYTADRSNGREALFAGCAETEKCYPLVVLMRYNIPCLLPTEGQGKHVRGELYEVNDAMLTHMDSLEGCPRYYERCGTLSVRLLDDCSPAPALEGKKKGDLVQCNVYFFPDAKPESLNNRPLLSDYNSLDAPRYVPKEDVSGPRLMEEVMGEVKFLTKPMEERLVALRD